MQKWEYLVVELKGQKYTDDNDELDRLGQNGWELVTVLFAEGAQFPVGYFKQPA